MRQIKFRAWKSDGEKMCMSYHPLLGYSEYVDLNEQISCASKNNVTLMQFTGLLDKNGKEIYEGDVVKEGVDDINYEVAFQQCGFWLVDRDNETGWPDLGDIEIIGNIYNNPELLK